METEDYYHSEDPIQFTTLYSELNLFKIIYSSRNFAVKLKTLLLNVKTFYFKNLFYLKWIVNFLNIKKGVLTQSKLTPESIFLASRKKNQGLQQIEEYILWLNILLMKYLHQLISE